ncbi:type II secretion system major pseudopilin GspG [Sphingosinicella sp.]|uniref:type II secretion system major pseudopilin GspG n=1 Tax=Sphingosinicella sp. TaxID=1917971 RepID=UPI00345D8AA7
MQTPEKKKKREDGFTLVELMVVLAIIGLLTTFVVINVLPSQDRAMVEKARADIALIGQAMEMYRIDNMTYPRAEDGLQALVAPPATLARPDRYRSGGYLQRLPADPWGNPYQYAFPGTHGRFDIFSFGADGKPGGEGDDADLGNWQN